MALEMIYSKEEKRRKFKLIIIKEPEDINKLRNLKMNTTAVVVIYNDIDFSKTYHFEPIAASNVDIIIYGFNHIMSNLRIYKPEDNFVGLFSKVKNLYINDLIIRKFNIFSDEVSGPLAGEVEESLKVKNVRSISFIKSDAISGGLVGIASNIEISNSNINSSISGRGLLGGIAGQANTYKSNKNTFVTTLLNDSYKNILNDTSTNQDIGYLSQREDKIILEMLKTIKD